MSSATHSRFTQFLSDMFNPALFRKDKPTMTEDPNKDGSVSADILMEAAKIVEGSRGQTHGAKERSFAVIGSLWTTYLTARKGRELRGINAFDVAWMMVLLKVARSIQGTPVRDHFVDAAGYSGIAGEISAAEPDDFLDDPEVFLRAKVPVAVHCRIDAKEAAELVAVAAEEATRPSTPYSLLRTRLEDANKRLEVAAAVFDTYAAGHRAKGSTVKTERNEKLAAFCRGQLPLSDAPMLTLTATSPQEASEAAREKRLARQAIRAEVLREFLNAEPPFKDGADRSYNEGHADGIRAYVAVITNLMNKED